MKKMLSNRYEDLMNDVLLLVRKYLHYSYQTDTE